MQINQLLHGFRVQRIRFSDELSGSMIEMTHEKTGARLFWLDNGAENKVFSIAFRTLPTDNTGVFHILEHSVLCGSEKYPVKEPFVELLKGSMNTFLNAMTFPDMTMYPVSSRNDRDLLNLTEVYLDAVFCPRILADERLFRQEGWHIEPGEGKDSFLYKGVVFNEMKGAMSDVREVGEREISRLLFPDTGYGFNSGGDPEWIPSLTYDQFKAVYLRHYHPSNAWIYLDGAIPTEEMLALLDSYLSRYTPEYNLPRFTYQKPVSSVREMEYELGQEESPENKGHLYLSRILGTWKDKTLNMAASIVGDVLTGNNDAPLKRLILEKNLAQDFSLTVDDTALQSILTFHAENITDGREQEIVGILAGYADQIRKNGLDSAAVEASLNRFIFALKEEDEPQGIERAVRVMGSWLYEGDPVFALENNPQIVELREMLSSGAFNSLAVSLLTESRGLCRLLLRPSKTLGEKKRREEALRLKNITSSWTEKKKAANHKLVSSLQTWQETPDSPENLQTLPMLRKEDANIPPEWPETEVRNMDGVRILIHPQPTGGILHLRALFFLSDCTLEELQGLSLCCSLLGCLPTARHDSASLQQEIKRVTGRLAFSVSSRPHPSDPSLCTPFFIASVSVLKENISRAEDLLLEILQTTNFSDTNKINEIIQQLEMSSRMRIVSAGHAVGIRCVLSHFSSEGVLRNALEGDLAVKYLHRFAANPESLLPSMRAAANKLSSSVICKQRLVLSLTSDLSEIPVCSFLRSLPEGSSVSEYVSYSLNRPYRIGYRIPSQVGFAVRGYHLSMENLPFAGHYLLIANILSFSWLWNQVRVLGGAYGCGFHADRSGNLFSYSYRDPSPARTLTADAGASAFIRDFLHGNESLDKYIISTLNDLNPLLSPREKGALADARYLNGYSMEKAERIRREVLQAAPENLENTAALLDSFAEKGSVCVVAPGELLEKCQDLEISDL